MKVQTHGGVYHCDDTAAVAALSILYPKITIIRDSYTNAKVDFRIDTGRQYDPTKKYFDHHQELHITHPEGSPYASFGLLWLHYGTEIVSCVVRKMLSTPRLEAFPSDLRRIRSRKNLTKVASCPKLAVEITEDIRKNLVVPIDNWDNGIFPVGKSPEIHLSAIVSTMSDAGHHFHLAIRTVKSIILAYIKTAIVSHVRKIYIRDDYRILELGVILSPTVAVPSLYWLHQALPDVFIDTVISPNVNQLRYWRVISRKINFQQEEYLSKAGVASFRTQNEAIAAVHTHQQHNDDSSKTEPQTNQGSPQNDPENVSTEINEPPHNDRDQGV
jgi:hypothetical protein